MDNRFDPDLSKPRFSKLHQAVLAAFKRLPDCSRPECSANDNYTRVLVACSGGKDSVVLLDLLKDLAAILRLQIGVAHLDHGLRPESAADAE